MFIPTTMEEARERGWDRVDVVLVSGDAYIDAPSMGVSVIGQVLIAAGYRVGIIAQPDTRDDRDIARLGEPLLFWGVSAGSVDSLISNYTASGKRRNQDDLTPGGKNNRRPDRAVIAYTNLIRRYFKKTVPVVLGGIEASMRRVAHYDFWDNAIRRSVLFDAKADILVYGMAERAVVELAGLLKAERHYRNLRGICRIADTRPEESVELPSFESVREDTREFEKMHRLFYVHGDASRGKTLAQKHGDRYLVINPPAPDITSEELDRVHELPYERAVHPLCAARGEVRAIDTIRFSITTHRGCFGECNFCAIAVHQGCAVISRSEASIIREARDMTRHRAFRGIISDVGGATANMYGMRCSTMARKGPCVDKHCCYPHTCRGMSVSHKSLISLLAKIRKVPGVRKAFVASGIRHDLVLADREAGELYLSDIVKHHVSGQLKIAPEHCVDHVLDLMGKPDADSLIAFRDLFDRLNRQHRKKQFLTYYLVAAHPGSTQRDMLALKKFVLRELQLIPEQVQIFTPSPLTWSTLMYYTGRDPFTGEDIFVERDPRRREAQKRALMVHKKNI